MAVLIKSEYVLYFGRFSEEKGIRTLIKACERLPEIPFVFAGSGPLEEEINALPNVRNVGFQSGNELDRLIREARFSVCPSEVYENCPFAVMESQQRGTPVVGARIGGVPELVTDGADGRLFESRNDTELADMIRELWSAPEKAEEYAKNCLNIRRGDLDAYYGKIVRIYEGGGITIAAHCRLEYVFYFGRYSREKGIETLCGACRELPEIPFVFAGKGPLSPLLESVDNAINIGFQTQEWLKRWIRNAKFVVVPSEWYEPFGLSVMEALSEGVPVIGADIAGIREIIAGAGGGILFESGNKDDLKDQIYRLWYSSTEYKAIVKKCGGSHFMTTEDYYHGLINGIYTGDDGNEDTDRKNGAGGDPGREIYL